MKRVAYQLRMLLAERLLHAGFLLGADGWSVDALEAWGEFIRRLKEDLVS